MSVLPDWLIQQLECVVPCAPNEHRPDTISYGLSSYGYDLRADYRWKVFTNVWGSVVDPKNFDPKSFVDINVTNYVTIPPNSFALCSSIERVRVPRSCLALVIGKSTYARCGIVLNCTPLEPEWEGHVTLEVSNTTPLPAKVYSGEGIGQVLFMRCDHTNTLVGYLGSVLSSGSRSQMETHLLSDTCKVSYADKKGKYQDQSAEVTLPKVD